VAILAFSFYYNYWRFDSIGDIAELREVDYSMDISITSAQFEK